MKSLLRASLAAVALIAATAASAQQDLRPITIALSSSSLGPAAPRIAKEMGFFAEQGLDPTIVPMDSGNTALAALISGSADAAMVGSGTLISASARGQKVVIIANGYGGFATTLVVAKGVAEDLGVALDAPVAERLKAVDGLVIGTPEPTAGATLGFKNAAATAGAEMRFSYMSQQAMPAALESGAIQGFLASAPFWTGPIASGAGVVWISGPKGELPKGSANATSTQLQMLRERAEAEPELAANLAAVFAELRQAIEERPEEVKAAVGRIFPDLTPEMLDIVYASESPAWNARPLTPEDMAAEIAFVKASGTNVPGLDAVDPATLIYAP